MIGRPVQAELAHILTLFYFRSDQNRGMLIFCKGLGQVIVPRSQSILRMTYVVVAFSILVGGLTIGPMLNRLGLTGQSKTDAH
tara:strand:+ start:468 stop:716 length:249 start_codon:yes stop_codon:yes gene_type:complete